MHETELDAKNTFRAMDKGNAIFVQHACSFSLHTYAHTDGNGEMVFEEFVLVLVLPKSTDQISAEQFADSKQARTHTHTRTHTHNSVFVIL